MIESVSYLAWLPPLVTARCCICQSQHGIRAVVEDEAWGRKMSLGALRDNRLDIKSILLLSGGMGMIYCKYEKQEIFQTTTAM